MKAEPLKPANLHESSWIFTVPSFTLCNAVELWPFFNHPLSATTMSCRGAFAEPRLRRLQRCIFKATKEVSSQWPPQPFRCWYHVVTIGTRLRAFTQKKTQKPGGQASFNTCNHSEDSVQYHWITKTKMMSLMSSSHPRWNTKMSFFSCPPTFPARPHKRYMYQVPKKKNFEKKMCDSIYQIYLIYHISKSKRFQIFQSFKSVEMPPPKLVSLEFKQRRLRQPTATTVDPTLTLHTLSCLCGSTTRRQESWQTCHDTAAQSLEEPS